MTSSDLSCTPELAFKSDLVPREWKQKVALAPARSTSNESCRVHKVANIMLRVMVKYRDYTAI
jgi:hypothetical protein